MVLGSVMALDSDLGTVKAPVTASDSELATVTAKARVTVTEILTASILHHFYVLRQLLPLPPLRMQG